jgi:mono/diheme cytochrome c family protein
VNEANERRVSKIDVGGLVNGTSSSMPLIDSTTATSEALPASIANGKRIFFDASDPRMSRDGYMSCASCHLEGDGDGRVWDFKDRGQGFRNTADLRGHGGTAQGRVHWTGNFNEIQDFELDIRGALAPGGFRTGLGGTGFIVDGVNGGRPWPALGVPNQGRSRELDDLAAYISSLDGAPPSPFRAPDGQLTRDAALGKASFESPGQNCVSCHTPILFTDSPLGVPHDVGTDGSFDTPTLKGIWGTAPYLHDGRARTLEAVFDRLNAPDGTPHASVRSLSPRMRAELVAYLRQIDDRETDATHLWMLEGDATDSVGANHGSIAGIAFRSGRFGQAGYFDGSDHVGLGTLNFGHAFTITCWAWIDATASGPQTLVANTIDSAAQSGFRLQVNTVDTTDGKVYFHTVNGNTNSASTASAAVARSGWYSIAVTRNGSVCQIFVNGANRTVDSSVHPSFSVNQGTRLGSTTNAAQRLVGRLDQVRVFGRILSAHEIEMLASE